jgi:hypothetical protein
MSRPESAITEASNASNIQASEVNESTTSLAAVVSRNQETVAQGAKEEPVAQEAIEEPGDVGPPTPNQEIRNVSAKAKQLRLKIAMWIFMVALSAFIFAWAYEIVQLVNLNLTSSFEVLGYQLASKSKGISMSTFLQLNPATTYLGSLSLSRICGKHYIWAIQR